MGEVGVIPLSVLFRMKRKKQYEPTLGLKRNMEKFSGRTADVH